MSTANIVPPSDDFPFPTINMDPARVIMLTEHCIAHGDTYALGAKPPSPTAGSDQFTSTDCSGFVAWLVAQATYQAFTAFWGLYSGDQHDLVDKLKFKRSSVGSASLDDGAIRIAFLTPQDGGGVGHVMLITGGYTCESHGHGGPDRREWNPDKYPFMAKCQVYVLTAPRG